MSKQYVEQLPFRSVRETLKLLALLGTFAFFAYWFSDKHPTGRLIKTSTPEAHQPEATPTPNPATGNHHA